MNDLIEHIMLRRDRVPNRARWVFRSNLMNSSEGEDSGDVSDSCVLPEESMADGFQLDHI